MAEGFDDGVTVPPPVTTLIGGTSRGDDEEECDDEWLFEVSLREAGAGAGVGLLVVGA